MYQRLFSSSVGVFFVVFCSLAIFAPKASAITTNISNCDDRINIDRTTLSTLTALQFFVSRIKTQYSLDVNDGWKIFIGQDDLSPYNFRIIGSPPNLNDNLSVTNTSSSNNLVLNINSSKGDIYNLSWSRHAATSKFQPSTLDYWTPATNYVRTFNIQCGRINQNMNTLILNANVSINNEYSGYTAYGFKEPATTSGAGSSFDGVITGINQQLKDDIKSNAYTLLIKISAVFVTLFIGFSLIKLLRFRIR